ncbi:SRPBCC family protein [Prochlorococcus marinus]|uniref:SRPBCC family protein n=1 Tax=Prochlorococcus marinus TaxID=1219 RepID=UPI003B284F66
MVSSNKNEHSGDRLASHRRVIENRTIEQTMEVLPGGARRLAAQLRTPLGFDALWTVLTNYNQLSELIPNLRTSQVLSRVENEVYLKQVGSQEFLGLNFSAEVWIKLLEDKNNGSLTFNLVKGDFRRFDGSWKIAPLLSDLNSSLTYELTVQGCFGMPVSLIEKHLRKNLTTNLLAVEKAAAQIGL